IAFSKGSNRKETSKLMESQVREMMQAALADPRPSR
ncbi:MAG: 1-acyl-sn-glycerol-3-phosphate acyltransferase, partial [Mesorhizobium sp.]